MLTLPLRAYETSGFIAASCPIANWRATATGFITPRSGYTGYTLTIAGPTGSERRNGMSDTSSAPSFDSDIKPLFREGDRNAMLSLFDLWSHDDVSRNASRILGAVRSGSMPCDEE